ncbi:hypothetical protein FLK61_23985 [Paenalkalicoccus suaedae]|uniref:Uncharacterized protein n=1 Tax=Paenalkalicoccus suaedae TaxID=2592382 RepID=A0A859FAC2_9BACI|nr:hypothetical protein [Paenalkalicoccus suaedae]QKS69850.1 hypothetical protein FLK61_23985 [Paenalkalicoccus suaedae]
MNTLFELAATNVFTVAFSSFLVGGVPFLLGYFLLNRVFNLSKGWSTIIPGMIVLVILFVASIITINEPPYLLIGLAAAFLTYLAVSEVRSSKSATT